ncbi:hypothetical protein B0H13DRAFT_2281519 [Mycena leptocephala]|nr:hypothetical protein B0H13DRAFT_2281519 [Mycena leptocephala]
MVWTSHNCDQPEDKLNSYSHLNVHNFSYKRALPFRKQRLFAFKIELRLKSKPILLLAATTRPKSESHSLNECRQNSYLPQPSDSKSESNSLNLPSLLKFLAHTRTFNFEPKGQGCSIPYCIQLNSLSQVGAKLVSDYASLREMYLHLAPNPNPNINSSTRARSRQFHSVLLQFQSQVFVLRIIMNPVDLELVKPSADSDLRRRSADPEVEANAADHAEHAESADAVLFADSSRVPARGTLRVMRLWLHAGKDMRTACARTDAMEGKRRRERERKGRNVARRRRELEEGEGKHEQEARKGERSRGARELGLAHRARRREERVSVQLGLVDQDEVALPRSKHLRAAPLHDLGLVAHLPTCHICRIDLIQPIRKPIPTRWV